MSVVTTRTLHCDALDCQRTVEAVDWETTGELRTMAADQGWTFRKGRDLCEPHTAES